MDSEKKVTPNEVSALNLAYLGDAVFELKAREMVLARGNVPVDKLFRETKRYVNAGAQAAMFHKIWPRLTDAERAVITRGRNAKSAGKAKNASVTDYRHATGLEALFGYLHLSGESERLDELFLMCVEKEENGGNES